LSSAAVAWYVYNFDDVLQHVSFASSGPVAELHGKKDTFFSTLLYWLHEFRNSFFAESFFLTSLVLGIGVIRSFSRLRKPVDHFTLCSLVAVFQIAIVLVVFSFSSNRNARYLLPVLPYFALIVCWTLAQIDDRIFSWAVLLFLVQLASTYGQAFGLVSRAPTTTWWLLPPNSISYHQQAEALNGIVSRTCTQITSGFYSNIIGIEKPWLNAHSANYVAAKNLGIHNRLGCYFASFGYETDVEKLFSHIISGNSLYYVTVNPESNPVAGEDAHLQAINRNYLAMFEKVQSSSLFQLETPLVEDPAVLIFRRMETNAP